jgi:hypothetical protein
MRTRMRRADTGRLHLRRCASQTAPSVRVVYKDAIGLWDSAASPAKNKEEHAHHQEYEK